MKGIFATFCRPAAVALLLAAATQAVAADLRDVVVEQIEDRYRLRSETWFDAGVEDLYRVLTDYDLFVKFTSAFVESRNLEPGDDGQPRFYTRMEGCVLLFCKSFERHGHLVLDPMKRIVAIVDPETSDFKYSRESWTLVPEGRGTLMIYDFEMIPSFWVPPVVGPYYIKRTLREGGRDAVDRIEAIARGEEPTK